MSKPTLILNKLLELIINEYGYETVLKHLNFVKNKSILVQQNPKLRSSTSNKSKKKSATDFANDLNVEDESKKLLITSLAKQFDSMNFLPSVGKIKAFLETRHYDKKVPKSRQDATRVVIEVLNLSSIADLKVIMENEQFSKPSQLHLLSDAISKTGATLRGRNEDHLELQEIEMEVDEKGSLESKSNID